MTHPIRILALITDGFGGQGGISQYNRDLLTAWSGADSLGEIVVVPRVGRAEPETLPARVRQLAPVFNKVAYASYSVGVATMKGPFDLVFCGHIAHSALAAGIASRLKIPMWLQLHGIDAWTCPRPFIRWGVERSALVTVVSRYTKRRFLNWANIRPELVRVLPNTVSDRFSPGPKSKDILEQYGLQGKRIILTLSRISTHDRYKGHHRVLAVMPDLLREFPNLVYVVAGEGNAREQLQRLALEQGVAAYVKFIGRVGDAQLPDLYRTADVFVMPSTEEGFGIVFLEAMRSGIPAIGGNEDGSMDPLRDGTAGYAVSCDNRGELLDAIRSALENPRAGAHHADLFSFSEFSKHCAGLLGHCLAQVDRRNEQV
jgi:phosphatidylinositol alpha-1,6-mannosyltransferase